MMQLSELFQEGFIEVEQVVIFDHIWYSRYLFLDIIELTNAWVIDECALRK